MNGSYNRSIASLGRLLSEAHSLMRERGIDDEPIVMMAEDTMGELIEWGMVSPSTPNIMPVLRASGVRSMPVTVNNDLAPGRMIVSAKCLWRDHEFNLRVDIDRAGSPWPRGNPHYSKHRLWHADIPPTISWEQWEAFDRKYKEANGTPGRTFRCRHNPYSQAISEAMPPASQGVRVEVKDMDPDGTMNVTWTLTQEEVHAMEQNMPPASLVDIAGLLKAYLHYDTRKASELGELRHPQDVIYDFALRNGAIGVHMMPQPIGDMWEVWFLHPRPLDVEPPFELWPWCEPRLA